MIEKVARAMAANDSGPEGSSLFEIHWREFGRGYLDSAAVAIEAMREPTDEMLDAADDVRHKCLEWSSEPGEGLDGMNWIPAWEAMIAAALSTTHNGEGE